MDEAYSLVQSRPLSAVDIAHLEEIYYSSDDMNLIATDATNYLNISTWNSDFKIQIYNLLGSRLLEHNNIRQINVESLNKGVYLIRITNENIVHSEFFIKK